MRFLYSNGSQSLPTTSPAPEASLHPILKYIILPIQICQGFYCICISNLIKSFSGLTFFLEGNFKLNIFSLLSLSPFPVQLHIQIANHSVSGARRGSPVTIFPSPVCGEAWLCIAKSGLHVQKIFRKHLKITLLPISHSQSLLSASCYQWVPHIVSQRKVRLRETFIFEDLKDFTLHLWPLFFSF